MTQYKYQTNPALMVEGELGLVAGQLVVGTGAEGATEVVGNPANSTAVSDLTATYAPEAMDIASAKTLGTNFVFLNGTSFDATGTSDYEFEESNGVVYGLYGRTDGLSQQVYFSGAQTNQQMMQYTTVPYAPPFLTSSVWQAACVCGSDNQGFTLALRNTTPGSTAALRYIYVRHNGSLINMAGHTYIEITQQINGYLGSVTYIAGDVPKIVRVGAYFFITLADWQYSSVWFGGWNAQDSTYPLTNAAFPASSPSYTPTQFTVTTTNLPGGDYSTGQNFPVLIGTNAPGGVNNFRMYNMATAAVTTPTLLSGPQPVPAGWTANLSSLLEGEVDTSGNPYLAVGTFILLVDVGNNQAATYYTLTANVTFTAGTAGAYTNAQINFTTSTSGGDANHMQPVPFYIGYNGSVQPNEAVASNPAIPSTCVNKLPSAGYYLGFGTHWNSSPTISWYYSGYTVVTSTGNGNNIRGIVKPSGAALGSLAAAQANKLAAIYPMLNVTPRVDFSPSGAAMDSSFVQPSGQMINSFYGHVVAQDLLLSAGINVGRSTAFFMSKLPTGSLITDTSYNRFGTSVPGFGARVAEYTVNLPPPITTLSTWGCVWPTGIANVNQPVNFNFPAIIDSGPFNIYVNSASVRVGSWTLSGSVYQPPPVVWSYAANMLTQLAALKATVLAAAQTAYSGFAAGGVLGIEVVPVMNSAGTGIAFAIGVLHARDSAGTTLQGAVFTTGCGTTGTTVNLTNTSSVSLITNQTDLTNGVPGTYTIANDVVYGRLFVNYGTTAGSNWYLAWNQSNTVSITGDSLGLISIIEFNSANAVVSNGYVWRSQSRAMLSCSAQQQGLAIMPNRNGVSVPESDIPISRYATSVVSGQGDFATSFNAAIANPGNLIPGDPQQGSYNIAEVMTLQAINNNFLLQVGSISGRLNHKEYNLPSSFIDMTTYAVGTYYLYLTDTGAGGIQLQVNAAQLAESATSLFFGQFDRTGSGFANESSIFEVLRFGTSRLVSGSSSVAMKGSQIRVGPYVG